ncbi:MAG TPA: nucleotidyltransferase domain-containing protein [Candidatus Nanoarchaeia archaeon]|nr:nucleotidyltransferase domain-containing protein [Candidatus Nanoarchaeia archaeon]
MEKLKGLFFNESLRHWHFEDLVRESSYSRERVNHFLKTLLKEKCILRIKPKGRMPYYSAQRESPVFREQKRLQGLQKLSESGLFEYLCTLPGATTAIIFGSFARGDWNKTSDIDIFIYGTIKDFDKSTFEKKLGHPLQLFIFNDPKRIKHDLDPNLIPNIIKGFNVTGRLEPFEVSINA